MRTLQADRQADADPVVGGLKGVRANVLGEVVEDLGHRGMQSATVALPLTASHRHARTSSIAGKTTSRSSGLIVLPNVGVSAVVQLALWRQAVVLEDGAELATGLAVRPPAPFPAGPPDRP